MTNYPTFEDELYSGGDFESEVYYGLDIKNIIPPYTLQINHFIGEKGQSTSMRFLLISNKIDEAESDITRPLVADNRAGRYLVKEHDIDFNNDMVLVKDYLGCWDMLTQNSEGDFTFLSINQKSLELAKHRALEYFWEKEML